MQVLEFRRVPGIHDVGVASDLLLHIGVHDTGSDGHARNIGFFSRKCQAEMVHGSFGGPVRAPSSVGPHCGTRGDQDNTTLGFTKCGERRFDLEAVRKGCAR